MLVTFPSEITNAAFQKIYEISENNISNNIWTEGSNISKQISKIDEFAGIQIYIFNSAQNASTKQIVAALEKFGLQITKMNSPYEKINTIWFSHDVDIKAVKRLATFLIENKIEIEKIVYHKNTNWKQKITIGNHGFKKEFPKFTKEQIDTMEVFQTLY
jgi:hypothetical protein